MDIRKSFKDILQKTEVLKAPKHRLATFGQTRIKYYFVSEVPAFSDRSRLREGLVVAEKPKIILPNSLRNRFEGFGDESEEFSNWLSERYGSGFRGLQYEFRNELQSNKVEYQTSKGLAEQIGKTMDLEIRPLSALIQGPDQTWQISVMKFIVDECMRSFTDNVRELDERGFFQ